ncbi:hypothetical protein IA929_12195 [Listeria seeligeri]|uniref:hypothetical protein n=1 Tax=Listeria seeligeri TaxID=1640 RepID=UPI00188924DF|nr:hypothetical protein [Listeria seeligeri]MBF2600761.1 hypothetical protein [Listeria seeligeri]
MKKFAFIKAIVFLAIFTVLLVQATEMNFHMFIGILLMTVVINSVILFIAWIIKMVKARIQSTRP